MSSIYAGWLSVSRYPSAFGIGRHGSGSGSGLLTTMARNTVISSLGRERVQLVGRSFRCGASCKQSLAEDGNKSVESVLAAANKAKKLSAAERACSSPFPLDDRGAQIEPRSTTTRPLCLSCSQVTPLCLLLSPSPQQKCGTYG